MSQKTTAHARSQLSCLVSLVGRISGLMFLMIGANGRESLANFLGSCNPLIDRLMIEN